MFICRNCSQTYTNNEVETAESISDCPKCNVEDKQKIPP
jgi:Zn finger protein HypA/HybF involved in hydrogenase expression